MATYHSGDELMMMLGRARDIELSFEQDAQWEGYYEKEKLRAVLMELIIDSSRHAEIVHELIDTVKVSPGRAYQQLYVQPFNYCYSAESH